MESLAYALVSIVFLSTIFNFISIRSVKQTNEVLDDSVALLIPMRNEASNLPEVVSSALSQVRLKNFRIIALDDDSTDTTGAELKKISDSRFEFRISEDLPMGWLGKNYALNSLASDCSEEYLVFLDADVRLEENAVADSILLMKYLGWDYICPYPKQIARNLLGKIMQPLLQWSWFATLPLRFVERSRRASTVVANGQLFIVRNSLYRNAGGHNSIKNEVLDDLELARLLRKFGGIGSVVNGAQIASCEMYKNDKELIEGYSKSQWRAFGNPLGAMLACALLFISSIMPIVYGFSGREWGWFAFSAIVTSRLLVAIRTNSVIGTSILHPIAILLWILLIIRSLVMKSLGLLEWRGRKI